MAEMSVTPTIAPLPAANPNAAQAAQAQALLAKEQQALDETAAEERKAEEERERKNAAMLETYQKEGMQAELDLLERLDNIEGESWLKGDDVDALIKSKTESVRALLRKGRRADDPEIALLLGELEELNKEDE